MKFDNIGFQFNATYAGKEIYGLTFEDHGGVYLFNNTSGEEYTHMINGRSFTHYLLVGAPLLGNIKYLTDEQ